MGILNYLWLGPAISPSDVDFMGVGVQNGNPLWISEV